MELAPSSFIGSRMLTLPEVVNLVVFSDMHIYRLEQEGLFPARVHFCERRVGWPEVAVRAWMQSKVDSRHCPPAVIGPEDRFIACTEVRRRTFLSRRQMARIEERGGFPRRILIGERRVAWLEREVDEWINKVIGAVIMDGLQDRAWLCASGTSCDDVPTHR